MHRELSHDNLFNESESCPISVKNIKLDPIMEFKVNFYFNLELPIYFVLDFFVAFVVAVKKVFVAYNR